MLFICADGGGTKLQMLAFDENLHLLAQQKGAGVTSYYIREDVLRNNVQETVDKLFLQIPEEVCAAGEVAVLYSTLCSTDVPLQKVVETHARVRQMKSIGEGPCGLLVGALARDGVLTLAGTGSDSFWIQNGVLRRAVGGYGPVLGDEGSGYDLGRRALLAAVRADDGRGVPTMLQQLIFKEYGLKERMFELTQMIYTAPDGRRQVARATYPLGEAARAGDAVACEILAEGGRQLAQDTAALLRLMGESAESTVTVTVSGGAWKIHPLLWQSYRAELLNAYARLRLSPPLFEPVMGGVIDYALAGAETMKKDTLLALQKEFAPFTADRWFC